MDLIEIWKCKLACEDINAVDNAIFHAVLYVANEILHLRAVLLPCVCNLFIAAYSANDEQDINLEVGGRNSEVYIMLAILPTWPVYNWKKL